MDNPFFYSKTRHVRNQSPPQFNNYRRYKPFLKTEFSGQCVYCRAIDRLKGDQEFGADHYRPKKHYPQLTNEYLNLFYCCNRCNSYKADFWPDAEDKKAGRFVPNPCEWPMFEHLRYTRDGVLTITAAGAHTVELLDLNDPDAIAWRQFVVDSAELAEEKVRSTQAAIDQLSALASTISDPARQKTLAADLAALQVALQKAQAVLNRILG